MNQNYSKDTCIFIPQKINVFIKNEEKNRDYNFEGLHRDKNSKHKVRVKISFRSKNINIGYYSDPIEAHEAFWYKKLQIATQYINEDYPFMSTALRNVIYAKIVRREQYSLVELKRAISDGYFDEWLK